MSTIEARRDARYKSAIRVTILSRSFAMTLKSDNVSFRGMFLCTEQPLPKMQLLPVSIALPTQSSPLLANIYTVMTRAPGPGVVAGVGVTFYGLDGEPREQWDKYIVATRDEQLVRRAQEASGVRVARPAVSTTIVTSVRTSLVPTIIPARQSRVPTRPPPQSYAPAMM